MGIQRVDGEIAARGVLCPILGEGDGGAAPIGGDITPQGGDLDGAILEDRGDCAVVDPGGHGADARAAAGGDHLGGHELGGTIHIGDRDAQQAVAHRPADPADVFSAERSGERDKALAPRPV